MTTFAFVFGGTGGTERDLEAYYGLAVTAHTGFGAPPAENIAANYALGDGAYFQRTVYRPRVLTLAGFFRPASLADLHSKRKALLGDITRDALASGTFLLRYYGANGSTPADIAVRYNGGLEGDMDAERDLHQPFILSLLAVDPYWRGPSNTVSGSWTTLSGNQTPHTFTLTINNTGGVAAFPYRINLKNVDANYYGSTPTLTSITNTFTGDALLFNYALTDATASREVTINCTPGARSVVDYSGANRIAALLPGSHFLTFCISPGSHDYAVVLQGTYIAPTTHFHADYDIRYYSAYLSADGVAA